MTTKTTLYIGANDATTKTQIKTLDAQRDIITAICFDHVDGATIYTGDGIYKHTDGGKINEKNTIVILYDAPQVTTLKIADAIKHALNQESILIEYASVKIDFI